MKTKEQKTTAKESKKDLNLNLNDGELVNFDLNNLDAILEKSKKITEQKTNTNTQKGLYKFVFATDIEDLIFVNAKSHIKSLNFEKRNSSGQRSKFRKHLKQIITSYNNAEKEEKQVLTIGFLKYYKDCYLINDFTPESLCNISSQDYDLICNFLDEIKKFKMQKADLKTVFAKIG